MSTTTETHAPALAAEYDPPLVSKRLCDTLSLAAALGVRVENKSLPDLLTTISGSRGWERAGGAAWVVTTKRVGGLAKSTTALSTDGKRAIRAQHECGAVAVLRGVARTSGGAVAYVRPESRLDKSDLARLRGVRRLTNCYTVRLEPTGPSPTEQRLAELAAERDSAEAAAAVQRATFGCAVLALAALDPAERKQLLADPVGLAEHVSAQGLQLSAVALGRLPLAVHAEVANRKL